MSVFPVVLDSCVLYPMYMRDTLLRAADAGLYQVRWSREILDGATRNLIANGLMTEQKARRLEQHMETAFPEALVVVPPTLLAVMTNDPGDRHVLAAAVAAHAQVIVTSNLRHFAAESLAPWDIEAQHPDDFLLHLHDLAPEVMTNVLDQQAQDLRHPRMTTAELLSILEKQVPGFVRQVRELMPEQGPG